MAFDESRGVVVLFGGNDGGGPLQDTWEWDGLAWSLRDVTPKPEARAGHALVYDSARQRVVLMGDGPSWEWDGTTWRDGSIDAPDFESGAAAYDRRCVTSTRLGR